MGIMSWYVVSMVKCQSLFDTVLGLWTWYIMCCYINYIIFLDINVE